VGEQAPLATALHDVEYGVQDLAKIVDPRPSMSFGGGQVRLGIFPFGIGKIRRVRFSHARVANHHPRTTFHTVSEERSSEVQIRSKSIRTTVKYGLRV
jgi:hypothetical protein